jgi:hypothetical protein
LLQKLGYFKACASMLRLRKQFAPFFWELAQKNRRRSFDRRRFV